MPINAELRRKQYNTKRWREQRARIVGRAGGRCECTGECGVDHVAETAQLQLDSATLKFLALASPLRVEGARCTERIDAPGAGDGVKLGGRVGLGVAHVDHNSGEWVEDEKLIALCSGCHLRYDVHQHVDAFEANAPARFAAELAALERAGQGRLF
jgi:hypothetical protein